LPTARLSFFPKNPELFLLIFVIIYQGEKMKNTLPLSLLMIVLTLGACVPQSARIPALLPATEPAAVVVPPAELVQASDSKLYQNDAFGFGFRYPSSWFGPEEYVSDGTLRIEVGSDKVYPYGEVSEQPSDVKNSYNVVIQYTKNNQNQYWKDTYQSLLNLKDGETLSDARSLIIRVQQLNIGKFEGIEYISTLSETAQTDHVYSRWVILLDQQSNDLLTIMGQPNNVEVSNGVNWRDVYKMMDEANLILFHKIIESISLSN
jgi:hypothetical protein